MFCVGCLGSSCEQVQERVLDLSLQGTLGTRGSSGSASCPADLGLRELDGDVGTSL